MYVLVSCGQLVSQNGCVSFYLHALVSVFCCLIFVFCLAVCAFVTIKPSAIFPLDGDDVK